MSKTKTYDAKPSKSNSAIPGGDASLLSQRQLYSHTGNIKTPAQAGASGKPSAKYPC